jgi:MFS family permease
VGDLRVLLTLPWYRRLLGVRLTSQLGDGALNVALGSYLFFSPERAATAGAAALAFTVLLLPYSIIGPFAGVLLDRVRRRQVLLFATMGRAGVVAVLAGLLAARGVNDVAFGGLVLVAVGLNRFFLAGQGASLPRVVPADELVMANAVTPTLGTLSAILGGVLAIGVTGVLRGGEPAALATAALLIGTASALLLRIPRDMLGPDPADRPALPWTTEVLHVAQGLGHAVGHLRTRPPAGRALAVMAVHRFSFGLMTVVTILLYRNTFYPADTDAALAGITMAFAVTGAGLGLAAVLTPIAVAHIGTKAWVTALLVLGATAIVPAALRPVPATVLGGAFVLGLSVQGVKICVDAIVQTWVDDRYLGRAFALYDMLFNTSIVLAAALGAAVLPASGVAPGAVLAMSAGLVATAVGYAHREREPALTAADRG